MITETLIEKIPTSPAFLLDTDQLIANLQRMQQLAKASDCRLLYAMKALPLATVLRCLKPHIVGVSASSLFEARLAQQVLGADAEIHLTTPGLRTDEFAEINRLCSHISFNSLAQFQRFKPVASTISAGLRINPKRSYLLDERFDPCRVHSKLGVDKAELESGWPAGLEGVHLHTLFSASDFKPLIETMHSVLPLLKQHGKFRWINLGGGYLYHSIKEQSQLLALLNTLKQDYAEQVYIEPGKAFVGNAGYLVCTVIDRFVSDGKTLLIVDSGVNHHPEIFEYQRKPTLWPAETTEGEAVIIAGSSCLAGDVFGEYRFQYIPQLGERIVFSQVGAYSLIKANRFNGYNLPDVYQLEAGNVRLIKHYTFADYQQQWL
jgi:carboxynorspermidine decarboxylase